MQIYGFPKGVWYLSRSRLKCLIFKNHIYTIIFLRILLVKVVFSNHHLWLFRADFQKECGFWVDLRLISSKTTFLLNLLRILLMKVVFSNHFLKSPFSNLTFQSRFPKRRWFLSRFRINLLKNHIPFENSAREGGFFKSPFSNLTFQSRFPKKNVVFE